MRRLFPPIYSAILALFPYFITQGDTFGSGANSFDIEFVTVGNPNNAGDVQSQGTFGLVGYSYRIGKHEVTNAQYTVFLNAVAASDPYDLYNPMMGSFTQGGIFRSGSSGSYTYAVKPDAIGQGSGGTNYTYADKPVVIISWYDAIRFTNWLHNGQGNGDTENGAYTLLGGTPTPSNGESITRNAGARWWLPSEDEWYKAAYYDPGAGVYYDYPTGTNIVPNNNPPASDTGNSANYYDYRTSNLSYPKTDAGAYEDSASPYGTFDQGGNVWEWNELLFRGSFRGVRGGGSENHSTSMLASMRSAINPTNAYEGLGFRVASVIPEPGTALLACASFWCLLIVEGRIVKRGQNIRIQHAKNTAPAIHSLGS